MTKFEDAPHGVNETFELPIEALVLDLSRCLGARPAAPEVHQMAVSLGTMGQLQNVLVVWFVRCASPLRMKIARGLPRISCAGIAAPSKRRNIFQISMLARIAAKRRFRTSR
jgi:hypothetical protein